MRETWVRSLGWEDPLEQGCILAWRIPMDRRAWWATVLGVAESDMTEYMDCRPPGSSVHGERPEKLCLSFLVVRNPPGLKETLRQLGNFWAWLNYSKYYSVLDRNFRTNPSLEISILLRDRISI